MEPKKFKPTEPAIADVRGVGRSDLVQPGYKCPYLMVDLVIDTTKEDLDYLIQSVNQHLCVFGVEVRYRIIPFDGINDESKIEW